MGKLLALGIVSAGFFSSTFVLNRFMSLAGGHFAWTSSLRYAWMLVFLMVWLQVKGPSPRRVLQTYMSHWVFWTIAGTVGFGLFYAPLCYAASYAPSWVIASTWQTTILASPIVLFLFGRRVPFRGYAFSALIVGGVLLVNGGETRHIPFHDIIKGVLPVLVAAFAYPVGNQLVGDAKAGGHQNVPYIDDKVMESAIARVFLMTIGSLPFWILLVIVERPGLPHQGQLLSTGLVALSSGVVATSIFYYARHQAEKSYEIAAVDASQGAETIFSLVGEVCLLGGVLPGLAGWLGLIMIISGIMAYWRFSQRP